MGSLHLNGRIPNGPIREALLKAISEDLTYSDVCRKMGWLRNKDDRLAGETAGLKRCTGIEPTRSRNKRTGERNETHVATIDLEKAKAIANAIGVDLDDLYGDVWSPEKPAAICRTCDNPMLEPDPEGTCGLCKLEVELFGQLAVAA